MTQLDIYKKKRVYTSKHNIVYLIEEATSTKYSF